MKLIVGLGNPGKEYEKTRHNAGFIAIDLLLEKYGYQKAKEEFESEIFFSEVKGEKVYFVKPQTYMNNSGIAIRQIMDYYKIPLEDFIVIYDEKDFPVGKQQFKFRGSGSGHNGIKSIIQNLKTENFNRIRIGIGARPEKWELVDWVLSKFSNKELETLIDSFIKVEGFLSDWTKEKNFDKIMSIYNAM